MDMDKVIGNFKSNGYHAVYFGTAAEAADYLCAQIRDTDVGIGGSMTAQELNLGERLAAKNTVYWHWGQSSPETLPAAAGAQVYVTSCNGVSQTGELVNIDGTGNRVASTLYGHDRVYFVCGINKLAPDCEGAIHRARNIASPLNARRLGRKTPCAVGELKCHNCSSPERICKALVVLWKKPNSIRHAEVVLVGETLGY